MKTATALIVLAAAFAVGGCAGSGRPAPLPSIACSAGESPSVGDSLRVAELRYRDALGLYLADECTEAVRLLERALAALDGVQPATDQGRSSRESLRARVEHSLDALARRGFASSGPHTSATTGVDTTAVRLAASEASPSPQPVPSIALVMNERVEKWLRYFKGRGRSEMAKWLSRVGRYRPMVDAILAEEGLPNELFYLSMIESGLNPSAYSRAHAAGMWQFIASRGKMYGLRIDWWVDERRDPEKATRAACAYLRDLYGMFGSWELALAAYNSGEGRVTRARDGRPSCPDFWCLDLPRETEDFVPKFMAALAIGTEPRAHGFGAEPVEGPLAYESIEITGATDLDQIAKSAGVSSDEIKRLNPALRRWCTPPDGTTVVRVPLGTSARALAALAVLPIEERMTLRTHEISRGETLYAIAQAYGTTVNAILSVNDIKNPNRIRRGDRIAIPVGSGTAGGTQVADGGSTTTYRVRRGDTVCSIARRLGKRTIDVLRWNGLRWNSKIYPGDRLTIHNM